MKRSPASWHEARRTLLTSALADILNLEQQGIRIGRAIKLTARKYRGRSLGGGRRLRLSRGTLEDLFYRYERSGYDPQVFELRYKPGKAAKPIDPLLARAIASYCVNHARTIPRAVQELNVLHGAAISLRSLYRVLPSKQIRQYLRTLSCSARERARIEARIARQLARLKTQILAAV